MNFDTVKLVYFSPTKTTQRVLEGIAEGVEAKRVERLDLTPPAARSGDPAETKDELILLGVPVYEGRVAPEAIPRLRRLKADKTPAVIVVVYGNRDYEDALLELHDLARALGFFPIAGGAFIGEHSFANESRPMANGRPDTEDMKKAKEFGSQIRKKMEDIDSIDEMSPIEVSGNKPYIERDRGMIREKSAMTKDEICTLCGTCSSLCPVAAVTVEDTVKTDGFACILCCACVKNCPTGARVVEDPKINRIADWVSKNYQTRKEPEIFL